MMSSVADKDPVDCSSRGDVEYFKKVDLEFLENYRMPAYGDTCLSIAASDGQLDCCREIYRRCPSHLYIPNSFGNTVFHHAGYYGGGYTSVIEFFLGKGATAEAQEEGKNFALLLTTINLEGETALDRGLYICNLEATKLWIKADKDYNLNLLRIPNAKGNTPLHSAVGFQAFEMVEMLVAAEPDYVYSPNNNGETPLWIAMRIALSSPANTDEANTAVKIRKLLLEKQPIQSTVRAGEKKWTALQHAAHIGDIGSIEDIIRVCPNCMKLVNDEGLNFLHIAVKYSQWETVEYVLRDNISDDSILIMPDLEHNTPLHLAVLQKDLKLVKLLTAAVPDCTYGPNKDGGTPLSIAMRQALSSENSRDQTTSAIQKVLLEKFTSQSAVRKGEKKWTLLHHVARIGDLASIEDIIKDFPSCMELVDNEGRNFLHVAVKYGHLKIVEHLLQRHNIDSRILTRIDKYGCTPFHITDNDKNTPLHLAVIQKNLELVKLLAAAVPDGVYGPNEYDETPPFIAMRQAISSTNASDQATSAAITKVLLEKLPSQSVVCTGEKKWTSLHYAAHIGYFGAIEDIFRFSPSCVDLVDVEGRNFLHIAVKFEQYTLLKYLLQTDALSESFLNSKDKHGNTPLHTAAETRNQNMVLCLLYHPKVDKRTTNSMGQKVLDAITFDYDKEKAGTFWVRDRMNDKQLKDQSDFDLVVGALIATVSFTACVALGGGYNSEGPNAGTALLWEHPSFKAFAVSNNFALIFSLYAVFSHFCTRHLLKREDIIYQLNVATFCTLAAIFAMMVAFITGSFAVMADSEGTAITICVSSSCFFIFAFRALWRMVSQHQLTAPWNYRPFS